MGRPLCYQRDRLDPRRSRADDRYTLAVELDFLMRPAASEVDFALKIVEAGDFGWLWRGKTSASHDVGAAGHGRAVVGREQPALRGLVPSCCRDLSAKANLAPQVISVGDEPEVAQDFGLGCIFLRPLPRALQLRIEGVAVVGGLDVAARAGVAVPVPGAA